MDTPPPPPPAADGKSGATFALALVPLLVAGAMAQVAQPLAGLLWTEIFVFLVPALVATEGSGLEARAWLRLRPAPPKALALAALVGLTGWFTGSALFGAVRALSPSALVERFDLSRLFGGPLALQLAFTLVASVVAPLCEEVAFRGHLASALHSRHRPATAVAASAALFALLHLDPLRAPSLLLLGALYGWLAWRTGSVWPAVVAHAVNNAAASGLALALGVDAPSEEPALGPSLGGVAIGALAVALAVAAVRAAVPTPPPPDRSRSCPTRAGRPASGPAGSPPPSASRSSPGGSRWGRSSPRGVEIPGAGRERGRPVSSATFTPSASRIACPRGAT